MKKDWGRLELLQALPLEIKIEMTIRRLKEFIDWAGGPQNVYISFSGGKDSTVLAHIARQIYPDIPMLFVDTGLEFPEIKTFVEEKIEEGWKVDIIKPKLTFVQVLEKYGFPVITKEQSLYIRQWRTTKSDLLRDRRWNGYPPKGNFGISKKWRKLAVERKFKISEKCCDVMKKEPAKRYGKKTKRHPILGVMAEDSRARKQQWITHGCNMIDAKIPMSRPLSIWLEKDIWDYIKDNHLDVAKPYKMGYRRTGCIFCCLGVHLEPLPNRFMLLQRTHPKIYKYVIKNLGIGKVLDEIGVRYHADDIYWDWYDNIGCKEQGKLCSLPTEEK